MDIGDKVKFKREYKQLLCRLALKGFIDRCEIENYRDAVGTIVYSYPSSSKDFGCTVHRVMWPDGQTNSHYEEKLELVK